MDYAPDPPAITIRPATSNDADGITRVYLESAEHHARLDPERYAVPDASPISRRYREGWQHATEAGAESVTLVAQVHDEVAGFVDARLAQSPDAMHRPMTYCHIVEIAVSSRHQHQGVGSRLLRAAEEWGREHGAELASLEYLASNTGAGAFYERSGYGVAALIAIKRLS